MGGEGSGGVSNGASVKMMDEYPPCPSGRGSGRTSWIVDRMIDAVVEGQPRCVLVCHTRAFAMTYVKEMIKRKLEERSLIYGMSSNDTIHVDGSTITLCPKSDIHIRGRGIRWGEFWDHAAEEEI